MALAYFNRTAGNIQIGPTAEISSGRSSRSYSTRVSTTVSVGISVVATSVAVAEGTDVRVGVADAGLVVGEGVTETLDFDTSIAT